MSLASLTIVIVALICFQCSMVSPRSSEGGMVTVTAEDAGKTVEIAVGDILQIELKGTPTTGFWWYFVGLDEEHLELIGEETREIPTKYLDGAPILGIWQVQAKKVGIIPIEMAYYRGWEGMDKTSKRFPLTVHIVSERR